jgi:hypothetical protein
MRVQWFGSGWRVVNKWGDIALICAVGGEEMSDPRRDSMMMMMMRRVSIRHSVVFRRQRQYLVVSAMMPEWKRLKGYRWMRYCCCGTRRRREKIGWMSWDEFWRLAMRSGARAQFSYGIRNACVRGLWVVKWGCGSVNWQWGASNGWAREGWDRLWRLTKKTGRTGSVLGWYTRPLRVLRGLWMVRPGKV